MTEPTTEAGRRLLDDQDMFGISGPKVGPMTPDKDALRAAARHLLDVWPMPATREQARLDLVAALAAAEAAPLDVERLARALDAVYRDKWPDQRESHHPPTTVFGGYAHDIARAYAAEDGS